MPHWRRSALWLPRRGKTASFAASALLAVILWTGVAHGTEQPPAGQQLEQIEQQISGAARKQEELRGQTAALDRELLMLRQRLIAATTTADRNAADLLELERNLGDLEGAAARQAARLASRRLEQAQTIALLQRLALTPPAAQLFNPIPPLDRLRTDMQLQALLPEIQARAAELASTVNDLQALRRKFERQRALVLAERTRWLNQSRELRAMADERSRRLSSTRSLFEQEQKRAARLASQAKNLRDLIERLESAPEPDETTPPARLITLPPGAARRLPVSAPVIARFGESDPYGNTSKGLLLRPRAGAPVAAVAAGRVSFAGPFRGYGRVLILSHAGSYHTVLAGLGETSVNVGQEIAAGELLGQMPEGGAPSPPELYFEVRLRGTPIDPLGGQALELGRTN